MVLYYNFKIYLRKKKELRGKEDCDDERRPNPRWKCAGPLPRLKGNELQKLKFVLMAKVKIF